MVLDGNNSSPNGRWVSPSITTHGDLDICSRTNLLLHLYLHLHYVMPSSSTSKSRAGCQLPGTFPAPAVYHIKLARQSPSVETFFFKFHNLFQGRTHVQKDSTQDWKKQVLHSLWP